MIYFVLAATVVLVMVVTAILGSDSGSAWVRPALIVWLLLALSLSVAWALHRPRPFGLRRIDALWRYDRLTALLLVKLLLATVAILGLITLLIASE